MAVIDNTVIITYVDKGAKKSADDARLIADSIKQINPVVRVAYTQSGTSQTMKTLSVFQAKLLDAAAAGNKFRGVKVGSVISEMLTSASTLPIVTNNMERLTDEALRAASALNFSRNGVVSGASEAAIDATLTRTLTLLREMGISATHAKDSIRAIYGGTTAMMSAGIGSDVARLYVDPAAIKAGVAAEKQLANAKAATEKAAAREAAAAERAAAKEIAAAQRAAEAELKRLITIGTSADMPGSMWQKATVAIQNSMAKIANAATAADRALMFGGTDKAVAQLHTMETTLTSMQAKALATADALKNIALKAGEGTPVAQAALTAQAGITDEVSVAANRAREQIYALKNSMDSAAISSNMLTGNFFRLRAILSACIMGVFMFGHAIKTWFQSASEYAETNHLLYATLYNSLNDTIDAQEAVANGTGRAIKGVDLFGNAIESATVSVNELEETIIEGTIVSNNVAMAIENTVASLNDIASGLQVDPTTLKKSYATFYEMANSAGMAAEKINTLAKNMAQLTYDVGSLWDEDFESVAKKMRSALGGITTSVRMFGVDISRTAADTYLANKGFDASYMSLTRAQKMIVLYNMLIEGTTTDQNDLATSAVQPANQLRILGEQASYAGRALGAAIFPLLTPLISLFYQLVKAIRAAAGAISSFFSSIFGGWYDKSASSWNSFLTNLSNSGSTLENDDSLGEYFDSGADSAGGAASAAKELKKQLMGFDEINNITPDTDSGSGGGGGGGTGDGNLDLGLDMLNYSQIYGVEQALMDFANNSIPNLLRAAADAVYGFASGFFKGFNIIPVVILDAIGAIDQFVGTIRTMFGTYTAEAEDGTTVTKYFFDDLIRNCAEAGGAVLGLGVALAAFSGEGAIPGLQKLASAFSNLKIKIIELVNYSKLGFTDFGNAVKTGVGTATGAISNSFNNFVSATTRAGAASSAAGVALNTLVAPFRAIGSSLYAFGGPAAVVIGVIALLAEAFKLCYKNSEPFREFIGKLSDQIQEFGNYISAMVQPAIEAFSAALEKFGVNLPTEPIELLAGALEFILSILTVVIETIVNFGATVFSALTYVAAAFTDIAADIWNGLSNGLAEMFSGIGDFFYNIFVVPIKTILGIASPSTVFQEIGDFLVQGLLIGLQETFPGVFELFTSTVETVKEIFNGIVTFFNQITSGDIPGAFQTLQGILQGIFTTIGNILKAPFVAAWDVIQGVASKIASVFNFNISLPHISLPHFSIKPDGWVIGDLLKGDIPSLGIEWYAKGGVVDEPTLGVFGEAGAEANIPLQGAAMRPFAQAIAQNLKWYAPKMETSGSRDTAYDDMEITLLKQQNELLRGILDKDTTLCLDGKDIINSINRTQRLQGRKLV